jgi:exopolysaccharide biosynthesis protein
MLIFAILIALIVQSNHPDQKGVWQNLAPGIDLQIFKSDKPSTVGNPQITVVRFDPKQWELVFLGISQTGEMSGKTAREWCKDHKLTAAINAGMFAADYRTHTGYLKYRDHVNSRYINNYQSVLAFNPDVNKDFPPFRIYDLDESGVSLQTIQIDYRAVIQNMRLIKKPGINVWKQQDRKWSEAAIGEDKDGRILFIFTRHPFTMHDLNEVLLKSGIGIVAAQHLEGGPEAQLYIKIGDFELELGGSYETSYNEDDSNVTIWPIPNILGIMPR